MQTEPLPEFVHIQWEGPFSVADIAAFTKQSDYGIYQYCGHHPAYGVKTLLYIGKAQNQTFAKRLLQRDWNSFVEANGAVEFYLGRLSGAATPDNATWDNLIDRVEKLLINAHLPAHNAKELSRNSDPNVGSLHILNWGSRGYLLPEVSGARWSGRFGYMTDYRAYGSHEPLMPDSLEPLE